MTTPGSHSACRAAGISLLVHPLADIELDPIAFLERVEVRQADATLKVSADLAHVFFKALQAANVRVLGQNLAITHYTGLRVAPRYAFEDVRPRDVTQARHANHTAHLGHTNGLILVNRFQHTLERQLDALDQLVDDAVGANLHPQRLRDALGSRVGANVKADDHRARRARQVDIALGDLADIRVQHANRQVAFPNLFNRVDDRLQRAMHVYLDDQQKLFRFARLEAAENIVQRHSLHRALLGSSAFVAPVGDDGARFLNGLDRLEHVARVRWLVQPHDRHRLRGGGLLGCLAPTG